MRYRSEGHAHHAAVAYRSWFAPWRLEVAHHPNLMGWVLIARRGKRSRYVTADELRDLKRLRWVKKRGRPKRKRRARRSAAAVAE